MSELIGAAGGIILVCGVEQHREGEPERTAEIPGVAGVVLRDSEDRQTAAAMQTFEEGKGELAGGAADFEKDQQGFAVRENRIERDCCSVQIHQAKVWGFG